ncbi:TlpA family protein disulfide reductase [Pseudobacter ginsenosidimutans]|uniref:AhpC/TSA family protein n=2 Tax=Pseudobacter ginsenosidimutans TaxID=661488 RepID=A0A4Q7MLF6_9BACT|nr:redoxin domain-containing protein [Pseudobacter ginsenosidimutans]RZS69146.1 AhpC/TSA family protein [Pseudobacter ginsenosidimutans]
MKYCSKVLALTACALLIFQSFAYAQQNNTESLLEDFISKKGLVIGDSLPPAFWDISLPLVHHPNKDSSVRLSDYSDRLLVLDFWAFYCTPCIASLDKWQQLEHVFENKVKVIGIYLFDAPKRAEPFAKKRNWDMAIAAGNKMDTLLNQLFYARGRYGQVWIKDGKLLAIPKNKIVNEALVGKVLAREPVEIEMEVSHTYFENSCDLLLMN